MICELYALENAQNPHMYTTSNHEDVSTFRTFFFFFFFLIYDCILHKCCAISNQYHFTNPISTFLPKFQGGSGPPVPPSGSAHEQRARVVFERMFEYQIGIGLNGEGVICCRVVCNCYSFELPDRINLELMEKLNLLDIVTAYPITNLSM